MVRPRSRFRDDLASNAMMVFWKRGFAQTSMDELVRATGVSRAGIYADFGDKDGLLLGCLAAYRKKYVEPALDILIAGEDGLIAIEAYFDFFIGLHRRHGMPGPGCFFANVMTERAPHEVQVLDVVSQHMVDLREAFVAALKKCQANNNSVLSDGELAELAGFLATTSQGLWSYGRSIHELSELERFKSALLGLLRARLEFPGPSLQ